MHKTNASLQNISLHTAKTIYTQKPRIFSEQKLNKYLQRNVTNYTRCLSYGQIQVNVIGDKGRNYSEKNLPTIYKTGSGRNCLSNVLVKQELSLVR